MEALSPDSGLEGRLRLAGEGRQDALPALEIPCAKAPRRHVRRLEQGGAEDEVQEDRSPGAE
jgi:hypothetical protein